MSFKLTSDAFANGQSIPAKYSCIGKNISPALAWTEPPTGTQSFALIVDDPDAPSPQPWVHWVIYKIPATAPELTAGIPPVARPDGPAEASQGKDSWGSLGYRGPAPPKRHGVHHYHFKLYALDQALDLPPGLEKHELMNAMSGHILGHSELVGTYQR